MITIHHNQKSYQITECLYQVVKRYQHRSFVNNQCLNYWDVKSIHWRWVERRAGLEPLPFTFYLQDCFSLNHLLTCIHVFTFAYMFSRDLVIWYLTPWRLVSINLLDVCSPLALIYIFSFFKQHVSHWAEFHLGWLLCSFLILLESSSGFLW